MLTRRSALIAVLAPFLTACATFESLTSNTVIDPGKSFLLGGGQRGAFVVRGVNVGSVPVIIYQERDGKRDSLGTVPPRGEIDAEFAPRAMAIFRNTSMSERASVTVKITGDASSLSMRYDSASTR